MVPTPLRAKEKKDFKKHFFFVQFKSFNFHNHKIRDLIEFDQN